MSINRKFFFDQVRVTLYGGKMKQGPVTGLTAVLDYWESKNSGKDDRWLAYALGTAYHETDKTIGPIAEYGRGKGRPYGNETPAGSGLIYYGRGLVQLTWDYNYRKVERELGIKCLADPDLVLKLENAVPIMFAGMEKGWFTGKKFANYFSPTKEDWRNARRIINRLDRADIIADHAKKFYAAISYTK
jgi:putative chitinase